MQWNANKWKNKTKFIALAILSIICAYYYIGKAFAEETVEDHLKAGVFDTLQAGVAFVGAAELAASGNFYAGAALTILGWKEAGEACKEFRSAWQIYNNTYDDPNRNDRDISPAESMIEHGRD